VLKKNSLLHSEGWWCLFFCHVFFFDTIFERKKRPIYRKQELQYLAFKNAIAFYKTQYYQGFWNKKAGLEDGFFCFVS
jgi:hypothetical protein